LPCDVNTSICRSTTTICPALSLKVSAPDRNHVAEHEAMMKACLARNAELAARLLAEHFALTRHNIVAAIEDQRIDPTTEGIVE